MSGPERSRPVEADGRQYVHSLIRDLTEQRQQEVQLRLLASLSERMSDGVVVCDDQLRIVEYTGAAARIYGWSREEVLGRNLATDFTTVFPDGDAERFRQGLAEGREVRARVQAKRKDGSLVDLDLLATPMTDRDGRHSGWLSVARDITSTVAVTNALRESEERLRSIVTSMAEGVIMQDATGRIVTCNGAAERILGLSRNQMEGRTAVDPRWRAIHEDGSPFPGESHPASVTLRTGQAQAGVIMGVDAPGEGLRWISVSSEPLRVAADQPPYAVVATFADVTELRRGREALLASEVRYRNLFEHLREDVTVYDVERDAGGTVVDWILRASNAEARRFFGASHQALVGRRLTEIGGETQMRPFIDRTEAILAGDVRTDELFGTRSTTSGR